MKVSLITTTINVPTVLALYRAHAPDVPFFVTGDVKSPDEEIVNFLHDIPNHFYYGIDRQAQLGWECEPLIGRNTIGRRSIALLEALKHGAESIVSIDDDNIPFGNCDYFANFDLANTFFDGIQAVGKHGWFDVGQLLFPYAPHRGFPTQNIVSKTGEVLGAQYVNSHWTAKPVTNAKIGAAAGICLGDPDISADFRIRYAPEVHQVSELLRPGIVVGGDTWTVFNSQNSAFLRELAPCFLMIPYWGRFDDILASLIAQRVMRERNLYTHFGQPFVWQTRNPHDLQKDLEAERFGTEHILQFAGWLNDLTLSGDVLDQVHEIYSSMTGKPWDFDGKVSELGQAWVRDCTKVL